MSKNKLIITIDCEDFGDFRKKAFCLTEKDIEEVERNGYLHISEHDVEIRENK